MMMFPIKKVQWTIFVIQTRRLHWIQMQWINILFNVSFFDIIYCVYTIAWSITWQSLNCDFIAWIAPLIPHWTLIIIMKGSSYSLRVMKNARHKPSHLPELHHHAASSLAVAPLYNIQSPTPSQIPEEEDVSICLYHLSA